MRFVFVIVPALIILVVARLGFVEVRRALMLRRLWRVGRVTQGRCLRMYTTAHRSGERGVTTRIHHVYEFADEHGTAVRFEEQDGPATRLEGDIVEVQYDPDQPGVATALAPTPMRNGVRAVLALGFCFVLVAACAWFAETAFSAASEF